MERAFAHNMIKCAVSLILIFIFTACSSHRHYRVQSGDSLYTISWQYGLDYREVADWNGIKAPYRIREGQVLRMYPASESEKWSAVSKKPGPAPIGDIDHERTANQQALNSAKPAPGATPSLTKINWQWPTEGTVPRTSAKIRALSIEGQDGQVVRAAAAGKIVYAGNGLTRYGNLIIVKHDEEFLSAYAHNKSILVKEGEQVIKGQVIAKMGKRPDGKALLHFEIRRDGKPVNPLIYLPSRPAS